MKGYVRTFFLLLLTLLPLGAFAYDNSPFRMPSSIRSNLTTINIHQHFTSDTVLSIFDNQQPIYGLHVDMEAAIDSDNFIIRLILEDTDGESYLVAESYRELAEGDSIFFIHHCEESSLLGGVTPVKLKLFVKNANVMLTSVSLTNHTPMFRSEEMEDYRDSLRNEQIFAKVDKINSYNITHQKLWRATLTSLSKKKLSDRLRILGLPENVSTGGLEYYAGGIFDFGNSGIPTRTITRSSYVEHFDWRNRHGKNWMTPVKDQGDMGYCSAFAAVGCTEAMFNLYYNQKIDLDLSEQEAACCNGTSNPWNGMTLTAPLNYIKNNGVCDEEAYPFVNSISASYCKSDSIIPEELVSFQSYSKVLDPINSMEDSIKSLIIHKGPMVSGFWVRTSDWSYYLGHAMVLTGYGIIQSGDTLNYVWKYHENPNGYGLVQNYVIPDESPFVGKTYWIFKNSYVDNPTLGEYMYFIFDDLVTMQSIYAINGPFTSMNYTDADIVCEDADGDGYYYWGIGPKPASCPSWISDIPDGDDSDSMYGQMDRYGYLENINPLMADTLYISTDTNLTAKTDYNQHVEVNNNATWSINDVLNCHHTKIIVRSGSTLQVSGGVLVNADIEFEPGARFKVNGGGLVLMAKGKDFSHPKGVKVEVTDGGIKNICNL